VTKTATAKKAKTSDRKGQGEVVRQAGTSTLEWVLAGVGCLVLASAILYLLVSAFTEEDGPAQIVVRPLGVTAMQEKFVVAFEAENLAGLSVGAVTVAGELLDGGEPVEENTVTLDYLPRNSVRSGALIFRRDPARYNLVLTATSYAEP
jgi:uncharacterized protein (TIGR02588 family)